MQHELPGYDNWIANCSPLDTGGEYHTGSCRCDRCCDEAAEREEEDRRDEYMEEWAAGEVGNDVDWMGGAA